MNDFISILTTAFLFFVLILLLSVKPSVSKKITMGALALAGISGFFIYGYSYAVITDNIILASLKALHSVCGSFVGKNDFEEIASVPIMQTIGMQIFFAFVNICALYATASAIITTIGREALKKLRLWIIRRGTINLIYGINADSLSFGNVLARKKHGIVIFVDESPSSSDTISNMGAILKTDAHAVSADVKFLHSIGFNHGQRKLTLYALNKNSNENINFAKALLGSLSKCNAPSESIGLVVLGQEEAAISQLQNTSEKYGYGVVSALNEPQMAARLLVSEYPPCNMISFDNDGKATEDFYALVIGFGQVGQAVIKTLVMNSQFEGSSFHLSIFATDCKNTDGRFANQLYSLFSNYDITLNEFDARSREMYDYLAQHRDMLKYVVISTGCEEVNHEIAEDLVDYFRRYGCSVPVFKCSRKGVSAYSADGTISESHNVYRSELLCGDSLDKMAMIINHQYQSSSKTPLENWMDCDYFSRQSCRASADFVPALLRCAGKTEEQAICGDWNLTDSQIVNLSKTEHLRWCAFHYCMGFSAMTEKEFDSRAAMYTQQLNQNGCSNLRIGKNMTAYTHACLIPWDELKTLSEKEAAVTGKYRDYQAMDTANVMAVPKLLQTAKNIQLNSQT